LSPVVADVQVIALETKPTVPPIVGLAVERRLSSSPRRRQRIFLGEPPSIPAGPRVSALLSRGWRLKIRESRRSCLDLTLGVARTDSALRSG
jgi:hypothetical protein